jgi:hypothetical protein
LSSPLNREEALHCSFAEQWSNRRRIRRRRGEADLGVVMLLLTVAHKAEVWSSGGGERKAFAGENSSSSPVLRIQRKKKKHNTVKTALFRAFFM